MDKNSTTQDPNQSIFSNLALQEMLFDRMLMGVATFDRSDKILRFNPAWLEFSQNHAHSSGAPRDPGVNDFDHLPGTEAVIQPLSEMVLQA
jgi:hypothetical protein